MVGRLNWNICLRMCVREFACICMCVCMWVLWILFFYYFIEISYTTDDDHDVSISFARPFSLALSLTLSLSDSQPIHMTSHRLCSRQFKTEWYTIQLHESYEVSQYMNFPGLLNTQTVPCGCVHVQCVRRTYSYSFVCV